MRSYIAITLLCVFPGFVHADSKLMKQHCGKCHLGADAESEFTLTALGETPTGDSLQHWLRSLDRVKAGEMPPEDESKLTDTDRRKLIAYLRQQLKTFDRSQSDAKPVAMPRRMNNREFARSIADVLLIEDEGTHLPTDNLIGDTLHHGFDTHAKTLSFSKFHLEQYIGAVRKIVDATILSGDQPESKRIEVSPQQMFAETTSQNTNRPERQGQAAGFDFLDPIRLAYLAPFKTVAETGWYRINVKVIALDRGRYDEENTGIYDGDPIRLRIAMGDRERVYDLPDDEVTEIALNEWLAAGSQLKFQHPTDGLRLLGNGNFKFQNRITAYYFKKYQPQRYAKLVDTFKPAENGRKRQPDDWHNWVDHWMGPRPRILGATIEGPVYESWPPKRHVALIGANPTIENAEAVLQPIAERAWRRPVRKGELNDILRLVRTVHDESGMIEALREGVVSILVSPQFLLLNTEDLTPQERFASKFNYFIRGTTPSADVRSAVAAGKLDSHAAIVSELKRSIREGEAASFQRAFPFAWLELNDINFMAPDPEKYHHYHRKLVSDDMVNEVLHLFRHATEQNIPVSELLLGNYSFVNADLAKVYGLDDVPNDSTFRKYEFKDGRRGGLIGTGAFLTSTADSLFTSPIHRAIYVMENFLGIHPNPPPTDVEIKEPDVRQAKTIKEILSAHRSDASCLSCHQLIEPFGYAFENYGPDGSWRDVYKVEEAVNQTTTVSKKNRVRPKVTEIPIDAGARFLNGSKYRDINGYREILASDVNQDRIVRCFVTKLLTYANGVEPDETDFADIDRIIEVSAQHDHQIVETIAAVIDSPLFRE